VRKRTNLPRRTGLLRREKIPTVAGKKTKKTPDISTVYGKTPAYKKIIKIFVRLG
jgi:hypothetical protein